MNIMKKMLLLLVLVAGFSMTAQENTQKEEETSKIQLEKLESLLSKLSEKMVILSSDHTDENASNISKLITALEKLENNLKNSNTFENFSFFI